MLFNVTFVIWVLLLAASIAIAATYGHLRLWHPCAAWCALSAMVFYSTLIFHDRMNNLSYDALESRLQTCQEDVHHALASVHKCVAIKAYDTPEPGL